MNVGFKLEESETSIGSLFACRPADGLWLMVSARFLIHYMSFLFLVAVFTAIYEEFVGSGAFIRKNEREKLGSAIINETSREECFYETNHYGL